MSLDLNTCMDAIGVRLKTITGLRVFDYQADSVAVPAGIVSLPEVRYDLTKGRGTDHATFPVHILVSKVSDRASRDKLSVFVAGTGASSIKTVLDGTLGGVVANARVTSATPDVITVGGIDYLAYTFNLEVND